MNNNAKINTPSSENDNFKKKAEYYRQEGIADTYERYRNEGSSGRYVLDKEMSRLLNLLPSQGRMLDMAAGTGRAAPWLKSENRTVFALDGSHAMLKHAVGYSNRRVIGDIRALPFKNKSFDAVVMLRLLFHFPDPLPLLKEAGRVCRTGGKLVFETYRWSLLVRDWYIPGWLGGRNHIHSDAEVEGYIREAGFGIAVVHRSFILSPTICRFLPLPLLKVFQFVEDHLPEGIRVSALWIAGKIG